MHRLTLELWLDIVLSLPPTYDARIIDSIVLT